MKSLINCLLLLTSLPSFCMHGPLKPKDYSALEVSLKLLRNDSLKIYEWGKAFEALKHYTTHKKEFTEDLYATTIKKLLCVTLVSQDQITNTPIVTFYKAPKNSTLPLEKKSDTMLIKDNQSTTFNHPASFYKMLEFSTKVWRVDNNPDNYNINPYKWNALFKKVYGLRKILNGEEVLYNTLEDEITDTLHTMLKESMASNKTIWGDATAIFIPDSQQIDT